MKYVSVVALAGIALLVSAPLSSGFVSEKIAWKKGGGDFEDQLQNRLRVLLSKHPEEDQFRVESKNNAGNFSYFAAMVYDKKLKRLVFMRREVRNRDGKESKLLYLLLGILETDLKRPYAAGDNSLISHEDSVWGSTRLFFKSWPEAMLAWP